MMNPLRMAPILLGVALLASPAVAEEVTVAIHVEPTTEVFKVAERMAAAVEEETDGRITFALLGKEVGGERDQVEAGSTGEYQIVLGGSTPMGVYAPKYAAADLPFIWKSSDEARQTYEGAMGEKIQEQLIAEGNLRLLGLSLRNPRNLTSQKPVNTPDDIEGVRLRVPEISTWVKIWSAVGALPSPIAWPEVYTSLQTGVIEMQENPVENIDSGKLYEVQKYINKTEHVYSFFLWLANNDWWEGLSREDRDIIQNALDAAIAEGDIEILKSEAEIYDKLQADGMEVVEVDQAAFRAAAEPALREIAQGMAPEMRDYVLSKLD